ncbi:MAG TPA: DUF6265 family protein [Saprospiraceae bacterium]|nr:DUF6265 family protein [Saprospiraceae bacterium]
MSKLLAIIISAILVFSWVKDADHGMNKARWLEGLWENKTPKSSIYEEWKRVNNKEMSAINYIVKDGDTIVLEELRIVSVDNQLQYISKVRNQNQGQAVTFIQSYLSETEMIFENPDHDFPQQIKYVRVNQDSLVASIHGLRNGQERTINFPMKRMR